MGQPVENPIYLAWHSAEAGKAGPRRHRYRLPYLSFPLFSLTLELCCRPTKSRAHLRSSDLPPLPWFILQV